MAGAAMWKLRSPSSVAVLRTARSPRSTGTRSETDTATYRVAVGVQHIRDKSYLVYEVFGQTDLLVGGNIYLCGCCIGTTGIVSCMLTQDDGGLV